MSWLFDDAKTLAKRITIKERFARYMTLLFLGAESYEQLEFARKLGVQPGCTRLEFKQCLLSFWTAENAT